MVVIELRRLTPEGKQHNGYIIHFYRAHDPVFDHTGNLVAIGLELVVGVEDRFLAILSYLKA